jgi:trans-aconitate methyltransferase
MFLTRTWYIFLTQLSKSMKKYHVRILLGYYFKILGEALIIQDFWSRYYFFFFLGKGLISNFVYGTALKSYMGETDYSDKIMFFLQENGIFGIFFQINEKVQR